MTIKTLISDSVNVKCLYFDLTVPSQKETIKMYFPQSPKDLLGYAVLALLGGWVLEKLDNTI